jgi:AraC-like DNA-binding protein
MKKIFAEYYSPQKNIFFHHIVDYKDNESVQLKAESHSFYELLYIISGETEQTVNENRYYASAGNLIIVDRQQLHKIQIQLESCDYERYILRFSPDLLSLKSTKTEDVFKRFLFSDNKAFNLLRKKDTEDAKLLEYFQKIEQLSLQANDDCTFIQIIATILDLSTAIYKLNQSRATMPVQLQVNEHIRDIIHYIRENIFSNISLEKMSADLYLSPYHISHLFSKYMGMPLKQYINNVKIHRAEELINAGEAPTAVAIKLGFEYYSTFFNAYKKILGKTPSIDKDKKKEN